MLRAYAPNGSPIVGTADLVYCCAYGTVTRNQDGTAELDYNGETKVYWETQETTERDGKMLFQAEDGFDYTEDEIEWKDDDLPASTPTKRCRACHIHKPFEAFSSKRSSADGLAGLCKDCDRLRAEKRRRIKEASQAS